MLGVRITREGKVKGDGESKEPESLRVRNGRS